MSGQSGDLLLFVRILTKGASYGDERQVRQRLSSDPRLLERWNQVRDVLPLRPSDEAVSHTTNAVSAEKTAAFIEGKLPPEEAARFEEACWQSPALLAEVVSVYRASFEPVVNATVSSSLTDRLVALHPSEAAEPEVRQEPSSADSIPSELASKRRDQSRFEPAKRSRRVLIAALTAAAAVAGIFLSIALWSAKDSDSGLADRQFADRQPNPEASSGDLIPAEASPTPIRANSDSATQGDPQPTPLADDDSNAVEPVRSEIRRPNEPIPQTDEVRAESPAKALASETDSNPATLTWTALTGLVVKRDSSDGTWTGARELETIGSGLTVSVLPESWALAEMWYGGELVVGPDSEVTISRDPTLPTVIVCELVRGRVAFRRLTDEVQIRLNFGSDHRTIQSSRNSPTIAIERDARTPRVQVISGTASISGERISQGQQVSWSQDGSSLSEPIRGEIGWVRKPDSNRRLPRSLQAELRDRGTLAEYLRDLGSRDDPSVREFATRSQLALFANDTTYDLLSSPDETTRIAALDWIRSRPPNDPRLRRVSRSLADGVRNPMIARRMIAWVRFAGQAAPPDHATVSELLRGLNHRELAVRQVACYVLRRKTGRQVSYQPTASEAARRAAVQRWRKVVTEVYGYRVNRASNRPTDRTGAVRMP